MARTQILARHGQYDRARDRIDEFEQRASLRSPVTPAEIRHLREFLAQQEANAGSGTEPGQGGSHWIAPGRDCPGNGSPPESGVELAETGQGTDAGRSPSSSNQSAAFIGTTPRTDEKPRHPTTCRVDALRVPDIYHWRSDTRHAASHGVEVDTRKMEHNGANPPEGAQPVNRGARLAILIPAFNEASTIPELIARLPSDLPGVSTTIVVVIDDGSSDATASAAAGAGAHVVTHGRNLGLASAFRTAVNTALELRVDLAVTMDADLQFSPDDLPTLIEPVLAGRADFVAGNRFSADSRPAHMPWMKYQGNRLMTSLVNRLSGYRFADVSSGYRAYSREALLNLNVQSSFTYTQETFIELAAKGLRLEQVPVSVTYYPERTSYISGNLVRYGVRTLLTISRATRDYAPLTIFGTGALLVGIPGILIGLFVAGHYIVTGAFTPYIFLALTAAYLLTMGIGLAVLALATDMLRGIRSNQERLLYFAKRRQYARSPDEGQD